MPNPTRANPPLALGIPVQTKIESNSTNFSRFKLLLAIVIGVIIGVIISTFYSLWQQQTLMYSSGFEIGLDEGQNPDHPKNIDIFQ